MKIKDGNGVKVQSTALASNIRMTKRKKPVKAKINLDTVKKNEIDVNQLNFSEKSMEDFFNNHNNSVNMMVDEKGESSDDSIEETPNKVAAKMADNESNKKTNAEKNMADIELYKHTDKGPYYIIAENNDIDEFNLCELFMQFKVKDIINVNKISKHKVRILTKSYTAANTIIKLGKFSAFKNYKLYLPNNFVFTDGIVRDIPLYYDEQQLLEIINCKVPIVSITRLNFWNRNTQVAQPSTSLKITFRAATVPDNIQFMWLLRKVDLFVQKPLFCQLCLKYGHFKKYCNPTDNPKLCRVCAKPAHNTEIACTPNCKHCKDTHLTANKNCPAFKYQSDIKRVMAIKKITYKEAKELKARENPTPAASINNYKKSYADMVASTQMVSPGKISPTTNPPPDTSKEKALIIAISKMFENITNKNSPGNNDELLINISKQLNDFWKDSTSLPPKPSTSHGSG